MRAVLGERVPRLPRREAKRHLQDRRTWKVDVGQVLAAHHAFVCRQDRGCAALDVRRELTPGMVLSRDFRQWAEREARGVFYQHRGGERPGSFEREAVRGVRSRGPELMPGLVRAGTALAQRAQAIPVAMRALRVDQAQQLVDVAPPHDLVERGVGLTRAHAPMLACRSTRLGPGASDRRDVVRSTNAGVVGAGDTLVVPKIPSPDSGGSVLRRLLTATIAAALVVVIGAGPAVANNQAKGSKGGGGGDPTLNPSGDQKAKRTADYTSTVKLAIADIQAYWKKTFPKVYGGTLRRHSGQPDHRGATGRRAASMPGPEARVQGRRGQRLLLLPQQLRRLRRRRALPAALPDFGDFSIALVLAHEWGHAIQDRAGNADQPTIYKELQADCFAGAWVAHVANGGSKRLSLRAGNLDTGLAALLRFRDAPGSSPGNPGAHGDGFDRVSSFQDGFDNGPKKCATYFDTPPAITESSTFTTPENAASGGNLPADQVIPSMVEYLNQFYSNVEPNYVKLTIDDVKDVRQLG